MTTLTALGVKALIFGKVAKLLGALAIKTKLAALAMTIFNATNPVGWVAIGVTAITALSVVFAKFHKQIMEFLKSVSSLRSSQISFWLKVPSPIFCSYFQMTRLWKLYQLWANWNARRPIWIS